MPAKLLFPAELPERVELVTLRVDDPVKLRMPPPFPGVVFPNKVELETVKLELVLAIPPPPLVALLFEMVELETEMVPPLKLLMAPPKPEVELPEIVEPEMVREVPWLKTPPPPDAELPEIVEAEIKSEPKLLKAPPKLELFAPDTVTPEIVKLPKLATEKTLKLPLFPLILRVFAPGPVIVRVPAVVASAIAGRTPVKDIVAGPLVKSEEAKTMVSLVGLRVASLARLIASAREPAPLEFKLFTVKVVAVGAGLILVSREVSWGGRRKWLGLLFEVVRRLNICLRKLLIL